MLKLAIEYQDQLKQMFLQTLWQEKYKYYNANNFYDYDLNLSKDSWFHMEFVSVDKNDNVIGFLAAKIDRNSEHVSNLRIINFYDINLTFSRDFHKFLTDFFTKFNFRKINFSVVIGNPAEKMYDKYIQKYNGKVVGVFKDDVRLYDGNYYDMKHYEIMKSDFESVEN